MRCELYRRGWGRVDEFDLLADPDDGFHLRQALERAAKRYHPSADVEEFTLRVRPRHGREFEVTS